MNVSKGSESAFGNQFESAQFGQGAGASEFFATCKRPDNSGPSPGVESVGLRFSALLHGASDRLI
jgi:hypothetical protein